MPKQKGLTLKRLFSEIKQAYQTRSKLWKKQPVDPKRYVSEHVRLVDFKVVPWAQFDAVEFRIGAVSTTGKGVYNCAIRFRNMAVEVYPGLPPRDVANEIKKRQRFYFQYKGLHFVCNVPTINHPARFYCSCPDFRFQWGWWLKAHGGLLYPIKSYKRKTPRPSWRDKNPTAKVGICKHLWHFCEALSREGALWGWKEIRLGR